MTIDAHLLSRRTALTAGGAVLGTALVPTTIAGASPDLLRVARDEILKGRPTRRERVRLDAPELAENGNAVTVTIDVDSPMTAADHVTAVHLLAEKNPLANVVSLWPTQRAGRVRLATTIRLADSQRIIALVEMSNGDVLEASAAVVVTIAACLESG